MGVYMKAGARVGCSINASNICKPPWWKSVFGASVVDYAERERCEEREIASCLEASKEPCVKFAKEKCFPAFRDARIASTENGGSDLELQLNPEITCYTGSTLLENSFADTSSNV